MNLERLLKFGYFPKELPPPFTTYQFGEFCFKSGNLNIRKNYTSKPCVHNLARPGNQRRSLSILDPFNYYLVSKEISAHKGEIISLLARSKISISKPTIDSTNSRAYIPKSSGRAILKVRAKSRSGARFIVRTDISRFYNSIYTHSIPWAVIGKSQAKINRTGGFSNNLDTYIRNSQDGQTLGIPVGPDTSLIISELICSAIDVEIQKQGLTGFRFVDDFEFSFLTRSDADRALPILESILQNFELALNPLKSYTDGLPMPLENPWRFRIKQFRMPNIITEGKLLEYFDLLFELNGNNRTEPVLRYGIARLRSSTIQNFDLLVDLLLQCVMIEPGTLKESLSVIKALGIVVHGKKFAGVVRSLIAEHGMMKHGSEVAWAIWTALLYKIRVPSTVVNNLKNFDDSAVALLALHACQEGLMPKQVLGYWKHLMCRDSLVNGHWLLAYEADVKGWLPSIDAVNHIDQDQYFTQLKRNNIFFYDDGNVDEKEIAIEDRYDSGDEEKKVVPNASSKDDELPF